jgi:threonine dehydratase
MPSNSPKVKVRAVEGYGGRIVFCEPNQRAREEACARIIAETGATLIHPFENADVMAGQGTIAVELLEDVPELDLVLCPVGGGGVLCGIAVAAKALRPDIKVIATEPAGADDAAQSFHQHRLVYQEKKETIADGLRTNLGVPNFAMVQRYVDDVVTVSDAGIVAAMRAIWETMKIIVEPSGAVGYAAIIEGKIDCRSKRVAVIITGGNVDLDALPWMAR